MFANACDLVSWACEHEFVSKCMCHTRNVCDLTISKSDYNFCVVQYLTYIAVSAPNINQFHSKTSELLSEKKNLTKTLT